MKKLTQNLNHKYTYPIVFLIFNSTAIFAQDAPVFDQDVVDNPAAPIDDWILPMAFLGIALMFYFIKKKRQSLV